MSDYSERLFRGLSEKDKEEWKRTLAHSSLIQKLREILSEEILKEQGSLVLDYDSPSWAYKQADKNGAVRALSKTLKLLDQKE